MFDPQLLAAGFVGAATADAIRWWQAKRRRKQRLDRRMADFATAQQRQRLGERRR